MPEGAGRDSVVIVRHGRDDFAALQIMSAFDEHGVRVVAVVVDDRATFSRYLVYGQAESFDCDEIDRTIERIVEGEEPC